MLRIGFLHTAEAHVATFEGLARGVGDGPSCLHAVEPALLDMVRRGGSTAEVQGATLTALERLAAGGASVVVCTCSTLGPLAEALGARLPVPVVRVDRPMARAAVQAGPRIGVVAALESTLGPTGALLRSEARRVGVSPSIVTACVPEAWASFESGDTDRYLRQVADAARAVADGVDVVVLAQASMLGAVPALADLGVPVLASPPLAVRHVLELSGRMAGG
jgi:Asp/Glu/hydantoin racemase